MTRRRVVVTGLGLISPVGNTVAEGWTNLLAGRPGIATITNDASNHGVALGVAAGTATLSACTGSVCGSVTLTVRPTGFVFTGSLTALWLGAKDQALAIITARQTEARLAPAESAGVAEALPAGSRVRVLSERGEWVYCELPGAGRGWVPQKAIERVRPLPS